MADFGTTMVLECPRPVPDSDARAPEEDSRVRHVDNETDFYVRCANCTHSIDLEIGEGIETVYTCGSCGDAHSDEEDAASCCAYECGVCESTYSTEESARACCERICVRCQAEYRTASEAEECCA